MERESVTVILKLGEWDCQAGTLEVLNAETNKVMGTLEHDVLKCKRGVEHGT